MLSNHQLNSIATLLILGHFFLTLAFSLSVPLAEAPDEADHWAYVVYLAEERALPVGPKVTQSKHPPLYHTIAALFSLPAGPSRTFLRPNPDVTFSPQPEWAPNFFIHTHLEFWPWQGGVLAFRLARLWSVLISTGTVIALYGLARTIFPLRPWLVVAIVGALAFWPEFAFIGGAVNNDNGAALFGTLALWGGLNIYRANGQLGAGWWTPLALGLGLLCKVSTIGVWPAVGMALLLGAWPASPNQPAAQSLLCLWLPWLRIVIIRSLILFGVALLIASPWLGRNWLLYGDPLGLEMARQTVDQRLTPWTWAETDWLLRGWFLSFWGKFGAIGHIKMADWIYTLLAAISLVSLTGLIKQAVLSTRGRLGRRNNNRIQSEDYATGVPLSLLALATLSVAIVIWRYSLVALGTDQGRLLYPAVGAIVLLFVVGLSKWVSARFERAFATSLVGGMLLLSLYALLGIVHPAFAPPPTLSLADVTAQINSAALDSGPSDYTLQSESPLRFGALSLVAWNLTAQPTLYWRIEDKPTLDWRTLLRITAEDGTLIWEWNRSPGGGRWSTDRWPVGAIVMDSYTIRWPDYAGPGRYRVEVGVQPFAGEMVLPTQSDRTITTEDHRFVQLGWLVRQ